MSSKLPPSIFPARFQISKRQHAESARLYCHADRPYRCNHTQPLSAGAHGALFYINGKGITLHTALSAISDDVPFLSFCFLIVEGFLHTHDRRKYGRNLLLFALISEIPWNYMFANTWHYADKQNVFFTLFLGYLAFCALEYFWETPWMQLASLLALLGISILLHADYGWRGFIFLVLMYLLRNEKVSQAIVGSCWLSYEWKACFAFISINMYNGKRGFIRGKAAKYFFYLFYPVHITILVIIRNLFFL